MEKIVKMSRVLKYICLVFIWVIPFFNLGYWLTNGYPFLQSLGLDLGFVPRYNYFKPFNEMPFWQKVLGFWVTMIPVGFSCLALYWMKNLFSLFSQLEIFSRKSVRALRNFALTLMISQFAYPFFVALISLVLTINNPVGERRIVLSFHFSQFVLLVVAYAIFLVSWVMNEGSKLEEEVKATI